MTRIFDWDRQHATVASATEELTCKLTEQDRVRLAVASGDAQRRLRQLERREAAIKARIKVLSGRAESVRDGILDTLAAGQERRPVEVANLYTPMDGMVHRVRLDTGAVVKSWKASREEISEAEINGYAYTGRATRVQPLAQVLGMAVPAPARAAALATVGTELSPAEAAALAGAAPQSIAVAELCEDCGASGGGHTEKCPTRNLAPTSAELEAARMDAAGALAVVAHMEEAAERADAQVAESSPGEIPASQCEPGKAYADRDGEEWVCVGPNGSGGMMFEDGNGTTSISLAGHVPMSEIGPGPDEDEQVEPLPLPGWEAWRLELVRMIPGTGMDLRVVDPRGRTHGPLYASFALGAGHIQQAANVCLCLGAVDPAKSNDTMRPSDVGHVPAELWDVLEGLHERGELLAHAHPVDEQPTQAQAASQVEAGEDFQAVPPARSDERPARKGPGPADKCPGCGRRILDLQGEAPVAVQVDGVWTCSSCYDSGRYPAETTQDSSASALDSSGSEAEQPDPPDCPSCPHKAHPGEKCGQPRTRGKCQCDKRTLANAPTAKPERPAPAAAAAPAELTADESKALQMAAVPGMEAGVGVDDVAVVLYPRETDGQARARALLRGLKLSGRLHNTGGRYKLTRKGREAIEQPAAEQVKTDATPCECDGCGGTFPASDLQPIGPEDARGYQCAKCRAETDEQDARPTAAPAEQEEAKDEDSLTVFERQLLREAGQDGVTLERASELLGMGPKLAQQRMDGLVRRKLLARSLGRYVLTNGGRWAQGVTEDARPVAETTQSSSASALDSKGGVGGHHAGPLEVIHSEVERPVGPGGRALHWTGVPGFDEIRQGGWTLRELGHWPGYEAMWALYDLSEPHRSAVGRADPQKVAGPYILDGDKLYPHLMRRPEDVRPRMRAGIDTELEDMAYLDVPREVLEAAGRKACQLMAQEENYQRLHRGEPWDGKVAEQAPADEREPGVDQDSRERLALPDLAGWFLGYVRTAAGDVDAFIELRTADETAEWGPAMWTTPLASLVPLDGEWNLSAPARKALEAAERLIRSGHAPALLTPSMPVISRRTIREGLSVELRGKGPDAALWVLDEDGEHGPLYFQGSAQQLAAVNPEDRPLLQWLDDALPIVSEVESWMVGNPTPFSASEDDEIATEAAAELHNEGIPF